MRHVTGTYIDGLQEKSFEFYVASSWEELAPGQFAAIIQVLNFTRADKYITSTSLLSLLCEKDFPILMKLDPEQLHSLIPLTNFLLETPPPVHNYFPTLRINKKLCLPPATDLANMGFGEWCFVFHFYRNYIDTRDLSWLNKLVATIYRPKGSGSLHESNHTSYCGDQREMFNENLIEKRSKGAAAISERIKIGVFTWLATAIQTITDSRPTIFPAAQVSEEGIPFELNPSDSGNWMTVFRELLGPKWGTVDTLKHTNALFVLDALEEQAIATNEMKRKAGI